MPSYVVPTSKGPVRFSAVGEPITEVRDTPTTMRRASLHIATRNVLTGHLSEITSVGDDLGYARRAAQERADTLLTGSVWLTTGHPCDQFSAVLEAFPASRIDDSRGPASYVDPSKGGNPYPPL